MTWRVLRVFAGSEFDVATRMNDAGVNAYCPAFVERRRNRYGHRGAFVWVERSLFPGYMFARIDSGFRRQAFERGRCTITVFRQSVLSDDQIESVRETAKMMTAVSDRSVEIKRGSFVELWRGILKGERAEVLMTRGQTAVISLLSARRMLGSTKVLRVNISDLENVQRAVCT